MTQDIYRKIGALAGLAGGVLLTVAFGYGGQVIPKRAAGGWRLCGGRGHRRTPLCFGW